MEIVYTLQASNDLAFWKKANNDSILKKIRELIESIIESPKKGVGKPEPLKHSLTGCWSRRITQEHRIVYEIHTDKIIVLSLKGHY